MPAAEKILWVVNYDLLAKFLDQAVAVGATGVAIRTDNDVAKAIPAFQAKGIKVFGWRWPSAQRDLALQEADRAVALFGKGLDGYFADPEGAPGKPFDWDQGGLAGLAEDFCTRITAAAAGKPFGTTSHYRATAVFPKLPFATFFKFSTVLLPQAYWKSSDGVIGHGKPAENYDVAIQSWTQAGGDPARIVPMGGELGSSTADEIAEHAAEAARKGVQTLHFYCYEKTVSASVWAAVAAA